MPIVTDPRRPRGRELLDPSGARVARFVLEQRGGRAVADLLELDPSIAPEQAVPLILAELSGHRVAGDEALGRALIAAGARPVRHAHVYSRDLHADPAPADWARPRTPDGVRLRTVDRPVADLLPAYRAAFPADHPDWRYHEPPDPVADLTGIVEGGAVGPLLGCSRLATAAGAVVGAALVCAPGGEPPFAGPWLSQLFRDPSPRWRGTGRALLQSALHGATEDGLPAVGLAVSEGNPAERLYAALGFTRVLSSISVDVP